MQQLRTDNECHESRPKARCLHQCTHARILLENRHFSRPTPPVLVQKISRNGLEDRVYVPWLWGTSPPITEKDASMGTDSPTTIFIPVSCAPKKAPCPKCGKNGRRELANRLLAWFAPSPSRESPTWRSPAVSIKPGVTAARPSEAPPRGFSRGLSTINKVRGLVLDRILKDGMNLEQTMASLRRGFSCNCLGFVVDVLRDCTKELDMAEHRRSFWRSSAGHLRRRTQPGRFDVALWSRM